MSVTLCVLRMKENYARMQDDDFQIRKNSRTLQKLSNFSTAIANGIITPADLASIGDEFFDDALEFMEHADATAQEIAAEQASIYLNSSS